MVLFFVSLKRALSFRFSSSAEFIENVRSARRVSIVAAAVLRLSAPTVSQLPPGWTVTFVSTRFGIGCRE